ncbi:NUDIX hydrolase [Longispora albida]|uniref:NUDIX hydrolase n=1 Tax=Longispora albida TaxID=203523 RepID=UPI0003628694|nr:NUDIX domain-containing protein [Longispora albida]
MAGTEQREQTLDTQTLAAALGDVVAERHRQHALFGRQDLPDGTGPEYRALADEARIDCENAEPLTWRDLVREEVFEAFAESDPRALYAELTQAAGLIAQWMQALRGRIDLPDAGHLLAGLGRHRSIVDLHVLLRRADGAVLVAQRAGTGYADGCWHLPSGHHEAGESVRSGAAREVREEIGVVVAEEDLRLLLVLHHAAPGEAARLGLFFEATVWEGEPAITEPDKCAGLRWSDPHAVPEPFVPYARAALGHIAAGRLYAADGFATGAGVAA